MYESQYPGQQVEPIGFFGNNFGGNINRPVLDKYTVVGYMNGQLWLQSKTGDSSDSIQISFIINDGSYNRVWNNKKASFTGELKWDSYAQGWYYQWTCTYIQY